MLENWDITLSKSVGLLERVALGICIVVGYRTFGFFVVLVVTPGVAELFGSGLVFFFLALFRRWKKTNIQRKN